MKNTVICPQCGGENEGANAYCVYCGADLHAQPKKKRRGISMAVCLILAMLVMICIGLLFAPVRRSSYITGTYSESESGLTVSIAADYSVTLTMPDGTEYTGGSEAMVSGTPYTLTLKDSEGEELSMSGDFTENSAVLFIRKNNYLADQYALVREK